MQKKIIDQITFLCKVECGNIYFVNGSSTAPHVPHQMRGCRWSLHTSNTYANVRTAEIEKRPSKLVFAHSIRKGQFQVNCSFFALLWRTTRI